MAKPKSSDKSIAEMLSLAALVANRSGIKLVDSPAGPQVLVRTTSDSESYKIWAPQDDDAEAFRLAVAVHLFRGFHSLFESEILGRQNTPQENRMAILRAAAKMGELSSQDPKHALPRWDA